MQTLPADQTIEAAADKPPEGKTKNGHTSASQVSFSRAAGCHMAGHDDGEREEDLEDGARKIDLFYEAGLWHGGCPDGPGDDLASLEDAFEQIAVDVDQIGAFGAW